MPSSRTEEESDVCIVDFDTAGNLVAIELLSVFGFGRLLMLWSARGYFPSKTQSGY